MEFRREAPGDASMGVAVAGVDSEFISMECIEVVGGVVAVMRAPLCRTGGKWQMRCEMPESSLSPVFGWLTMVPLRKECVSSDLCVNAADVRNSIDSAE